MLIISTKKKVKVAVHTLLSSIEDLFFIGFISIYDFDKKYNLNEIIRGDSLFCATGITNGDLVDGLELRDNKMIVKTLITHKSQNMKKIVTGEIDIKK